MRNEIILEQPTVPVSGDSRYLTPLWVSGNVEPQEEIKYKIKATLKRLSLREQHVLVQFWSPCYVGERLLLTTNDQPFGVGVSSEELCSYRKDSELNVFHVDMDNEEEDISPPARVFKRKLPEWSCDVANYNTKHFPQQDCAIRCNLHGYLALPVFNPTTGLCVGVLELLMSSKLENFAYEVEHIHQELKIWNLTSPQVNDGPSLNVLHERSKTEQDKIFGILKAVCDTHRLRLAQTWTISPSASYVAHKKVLQKGCSSFDTRCLGKVCMSTALPYYGRDLSAWQFMQASKERHLEKSRGVVGRALSSRGSCFCGDVTRLDEQEYPLVHNARMSGLTSCFAIFLHSVECDYDYVLEFFPPLDIKDSRDVLNLVQMLKQSVHAATGFELGDVSHMEVVRTPTDFSVSETDSSDLGSIVVDNDSEPDYANVMDQWPFIYDSIEEIYDNFTITVMVSVTFNKSMKQFAFPLFHGLSKLKNEVTKRFKLEDQKLLLKYMDEDDDLILISRDDDLKIALDALGSLNLICCLEVN